MIVVSKSISKSCPAFLKHKDILDNNQRLYDFMVTRRTLVRYKERSSYIHSKRNDSLVLEGDYTSVHDLDEIFSMVNLDTIVGARIGKTYTPHKAEDLHAAIALLLGRGV